MINRVVLVGRLTRDVDFRKTSTGLSVARFTVACDRRQSRDSQGQNQADFISCVAWRGTADFLGQYAKKGALVGVEGRITTGSYEKEGRKVYTTEVTCDNVQLLESRAASEARAASAPADNGYGSYGNSYGNNNYGNNSYGGGYSQQTSYGNNDYTQQSQQSSYSDPLSDGMDSGSGLDISSDDLPF